MKSQENPKYNTRKSLREWFEARAREVDRIMQEQGVSEWKANQLLDSHMDDTEIRGYGYKPVGQ